MSPRPLRSGPRPGGPGRIRPTDPDPVRATGRGAVGAKSRRAVRARAVAGAAALALAALAAGPAVASAADVHVSSTGGANAAGCGTTEASACKTIVYALQSSISQGGDTLALAPGTYAEAISTSRTVSYRGTGPGVVLTGGGNGAVVGMSLSPATRISVSGLTFRAGVDRTTPELRTNGPVDVSDVRFDSAKPLDDQDPNTATGRLTMVGVGGRATGITIDQPATGAGTALAATGPFGDRAAGPVVAA